MVPQVELFDKPVGTRRSLSAELLEARERKREGEIFLYAYLLVSLDICLGSACLAFHGRIALMLAIV